MQNIKLSCRSCSHIAVCKIYPNQRSMLKTLYENNIPPFQPEDVATVCGCFLPSGVVETVKNFEEKQSLEEIAVAH